MYTNKEMSNCKTSNRHQVDIPIYWEIQDKDNQKLRLQDLRTLFSSYKLKIIKHWLSVKQIISSQR